MKLPHRMDWGGTMGYKIIYSGEPVMKKPRNSNIRLRTLTALCLLVFALTVRLTWREGTEKLKQFLLPTELTVAEAAFSEMVSGIQHGADIPDAIRTFCITVLNEDT